MQKLFHYLRPFTALIGAVLGLTLVQSLAELFLPTLMADIVDIGIVTGNIPFIYKTGAVMLLVAVGGTCCTIYGSLLASRTAAGFGRDLRGSIFARVESFSLHEFDQFSTASLITRTTNDVSQVQQSLFMVLRMGLRAPLMCAGGVVMALSRDVQLSRTVMLIIPVIAAIFIFIALKTIPLYRAIQEKIDRLNLVLRENLTGVRVIRAFNCVEREQKRFSTANLDLTETAIKVNQILAAIMPALMLAMNLLTIVIIWFGSIRIDSGQMQVGDLMAFLQYIMLIMFALVTVSMLFVLLPRASASAARINEVLDTVPGIKDAARVKPGGGRKGEVEFRHVTFSYPGAAKPALSGISFRTAAGETTAIIGGTGSGKTTLANLLLRFYDPDCGAVLINGVDLRQLTQENLRAKIGYVPQKAFLFSGSVAANIRFGDQNASDEAVRHAATTAQAANFISAMEGGFKAMVAQGGANLSGGQKQRLAIARALVRKPEIYVFDDSFSALDFKTDARLRAALAGETQQAAVIIIAQRVSTVLSADQIIVLDGGRMAGLGTHWELMASCQVYREIVASQLGEEEIA